MHKEIKRGKKTIAIIVSLLTITVTLYIYQFFKINFEKNIEIKYCAEVFLIIITLIVVCKQTSKCKLSYKYCIISDKLIINKIKSKNEENVESVKIKDILYIGEKNNAPKEYNKCKCVKHYIRKFNNEKKLLCIYRKNGKVYRFVFEPSDTLISLIKSVN